MFGYRTPAKSARPVYPIQRSPLEDPGMEVRTESVTAVGRGIGEREAVRSGAPERSPTTPRSRAPTSVNTRPKKKKAAPSAFLPEVRDTSPPVSTSGAVSTQSCVFASEHGAAGAVGGILETEGTTGIAAISLGGTRDKLVVEKLAARAKAAYEDSDEAMKKSGNIKREIKETVNKNLQEMYQIVEVLVSLIASSPNPTGDTEEGNHGVTIGDVLEEVRENGRRVAECALFTRALSDQLKTVTPPVPPPTSPHHHQQLTYAGVAATRRQALPRPLHSIIVSSEDEMDTSGQVVEKIRTAVNARETGIRVDRLRKAKDQKVVIGCQTREELERLRERLGGSGTELRIQEAVNRDPLVMLANVLTYNTDDDITRSILNQNAHLLDGLKAEQVKVAVKYRRRARNPHECHVVLQVSPPVWQKLTEAGRVHVDLQRVRVFDQSPLVQCSRCLGFGHGRKQCTGEEDLCSHCGGNHLRAECPAHQSGEPPRCCNCSKAKNESTGHNAFSEECPIRKRWDAIARSTVAYC